MAGASFEGDTRQLKKLVSKFDSVATSGWYSRVNRHMAEEALELTHDGFDRSVDPYERPWKAVKRGGQPLRLTRRLEASIAPSWSPGAFKLNTNVIYAATHQWGRDPIAQRMFLPSSAMGLGNRWHKALYGVMARQIQLALVGT